MRVLPAEPDDDGGTDPQLLAATPAGAGPAGVPWDGGASTGGVEAVLPEGTYAVRQVTAPVGLLPAEAIAPIEVCAAGCATSRTVVNRSTYRTRTEIQVLSADGPVAGTQVTLSGPGFPDTPAVTDEDGRTAWAGWFRPGEWWFTVAGRPAPLLVTMDPGRGDTSLPWRLEITLPAAAQPGVPAPEAAPSAAAPQPPAQPSTSPAAGAPVAAARVAEVAEVLEVAEAQPGAAPVPAPSPVAVPSPAASGLGQVFAPENAPALGTESSEQRLSAGLVTGTGLLFVALVLVGYGVLRSRQRRRA
ncbi:hypothetical protein JKP76_18870 [Blastococcus sp. TML/C7B]|uniref:hypothetical protein n=1 Tax=Blastococcus sp. TML/C7B TaxID=2798728 RepID=UPI001909A775|nr:hypothetical protein [Blastococcus sp. TML/C7B]MBN1097897.1 hypothetical protein [Blastococcus sp. TML/C7B]